MSVIYGTPQDTPHYYQNEQRFLYDLPEIKEPLEICDCCGDEILKANGIETEDGFFCKQCFMTMEDSQDGDFA